MLCGAWYWCVNSVRCVVCTVCTCIMCTVTVCQVCTGLRLYHNVHCMGALYMWCAVVCGPWSAASSSYGYAYGQESQLPGSVAGSRVATPIAAVFVHCALCTVPSICSTQYITALFHSRVRCVGRRAREVEHLVDEIAGGLLEILFIHQSTTPRNAVVHSPRH